jgi:hypothetical protein
MTEQSMAARLARIMGDVGRVEKKGKITSQGSGPTYKFARDADVLEKVGPMLADAGIVIVPEHTEVLSIEPSMSGKQFIANIKTAWHATDGKESIRFETLGQGADSGDKALPKAQSNARKYAFFMLFHIVTGDDPDHYVSEQPQRDERPARSEASAPKAAKTPAGAQYRRDDLLKVMTQHNLDLAALEIYANMVGIPKGQRATNEQMDRLIDAIEHPEAVIDAAPEDGATEGAQEGSPAAPSNQPATAGDGRGDAESPPSASPPPKPGTDEFDLLSSKERLAARAWWQEHPEEQATLLEALGGPAA